MSLQKELQKCFEEFEKQYQNEFDAVGNDDLRILRANFAAAVAKASGSQLSIADNLSIYELGEWYLLGNQYIEKDEVLAFRLFLTAAENGYIAAYNKVGECYFKGIGTLRNIPQAVAWLHKDDPILLAFTAKNYVIAAKDNHPDFLRLFEFAAYAGDAEAQYIFGSFFQFNDFVPQDIPTLMEWLHKSAEQNYAPAECHLGIVYLDGKYGVEQDQEIAVRWLRRALQHGDKQSALWLARCYSNGEGIEKDEAEAVRILKQDENNPANQFELSKRLLDETSPLYQPDEGMMYLQKSAEAEEISAMAELGDRLLHGNGVKPNLKKAHKYLQRAAESGVTAAQFTLGQMFAEGNGVKQNWKEAFYWYKRAADDGYVQAAQSIADCYLNGRGTEKDEAAGYIALAMLAAWGDEEALTLLRSAVRNENPAAEFAMSRVHRLHNEENLAAAMLEKSAKHGFVQAQSELAFHLESIGNNAQARHYYQQAAEQGDSDAMIQLALSYENGLSGEKKDEKKAFDWMKKAADTGNVQANYFLGNLYKDGTGTEKDINEAFVCYTKAHEGGSLDASHAVGRLFEKMADKGAVAFKFYHHAAEGGNPKGMYHLGSAYIRGCGCQSDIELGFRWIGKALQTGNLLIPFWLKNDFGFDLEEWSKMLDTRHSALTAEERFGAALDSAFQTPLADELKAVPPK